MSAPFVPSGETMETAREAFGWSIRVPVESELVTVDEPGAWTSWKGPAGKANPAHPPVWQWSTDFQVPHRFRLESAEDEAIDGDQSGTTVTTQFKPGARLSRPSAVSSAQPSSSARATYDAS